MRWSPRRNVVRKGLVAHPIESNRSKSARKQIRAQLKSSFFINVHFRYVLDTCSFYVTHHLQVSSPLSVTDRLVSASFLLGSAMSLLVSSSSLCLAARTIVPNARCILNRFARPLSSLPHLASTSQSHGSSIQRAHSGECSVSLYSPINIHHITLCVLI